MKIPRQVLGTVGQCIYCKTTQKFLSTEHVVPHSLNGPWELLKASCQDCADITSTFERDVSEKLLLPARIKLDLPTYHKNKQPATLSLDIERKGQKETVHIPWGEAPIPISLPFFKLPAYIDHRHYEKGIDLCDQLWTVFGVSRIKEIATKYDADSLSIGITYKPVEFARLLAKIAYGFAVAHYGLNKIQEAYVLPAIRRELDDVGRWVGCKTTGLLGPGKNLHEIKLISVNEEIHCNLRLLSQLNTPEYLVIVGRASQRP